MARPNSPTLAQIKQQREELLAQVDLPSQHSTGPADPDPASPPITALPTPEPLPVPSEPTPLWSARDHEYGERMQEEAAEPEGSPSRQLVRIAPTF
jgi:hypothetical protein